MTARCGLHDDAENSNERGTNEQKSSTPSVGDGGGNQSPEEASCLEGGNDIGRQIGLAHLIEVLETVFSLKPKTELAPDWTLRREPYAWNGGMVRTPPMIPESMPNNIPPKQA